jgi:ATP-dependent protease ClpP protease subunit
MIRINARSATEADILVYSPIGEDWLGNGVTAKKFRDELAALGAVQNITVRINSPGGEVFDGLSIANALREHKAHVVVHVDGLAASIASVIAMAGDEIVMGLGSMMMIHSPWAIALGNADQMRQQAAVLDKVEEGMVDIYVTRTGLERDAVLDMMKAETWFTAAEAVENGFADSMGGTAEADEAQPAAAFAALRAPTMHQLHAALTKVPDKFRAAPAAAIQPTTEVTAKSPQEKQTMDTPNPSGAAASDPTIKAAVLAADKARREDIRTVFGRFATEHAETLAACLDDHNCTVDGASKKLLAALAEKAEPIRDVRGTAAVTVDARDKFLAGAENAILARAGKAKIEAGNEYNGYSLLDIGEKALAMIGVSVKGMTKSQVASKLFASHSTSDFPLLLSNTAGKMLRDAYSAWPTTWGQLASVRSVSDFKPISNIQLGTFNNLETIPEGGEYTYGTFGESAETNRALTKGKALMMTRQMVINDDLGGFNRRATMMGSAAARTVNRDFYALLVSGVGNNGPTLSDTIQFFNAAHNNLVAAGAITVANLSLAKTQMRRQRALLAPGQTTVEYLNISPRYLLCGVSREDLAREVISSTTKDGQGNANQPNVLRNFADVVSDPIIDEIAPSPWYLWADPALIEGIQAVFLDGNQTPYVDEQIEWDTDALKFKIRLDYGFGAVDFRAGVKNPGT